MTDEVGLVRGREEETGAVKGEREKQSFFLYLSIYLSLSYFYFLLILSHSFLALPRDHLFH